MMDACIVDGVVYKTARGKGFFEADCNGCAGEGKPLCAELGPCVAELREDATDIIWIKHN